MFDIGGLRESLDQTNINLISSGGEGEGEGEGGGVHPLEVFPLQSPQISTDRLQTF